MYSVGGTILDTILILLMTIKATTTMLMITMMIPREITMTTKTIMMTMITIKVENHSKNDDEEKKMMTTQEKYMKKRMMTKTMRIMTTIKVTIHKHNYNDGINNGDKNDE